MNKFPIQLVKDNLGCQYPGVPDGELALNIETAEFEFTGNSGVPIDTNNRMHLMAVCLYIHSLYESKEDLRFGWRARFGDCWRSAKFQEQYRSETGHYPTYWFFDTPGCMSGASGI